MYLKKVDHTVYPRQSMRLFAACPAKAVMSVITVNRVQLDYDVPIYLSNEKTTDEMLQYFVNERELDLLQYSSSTFNSVHIKDVFLSKQRAKLNTKRRKNAVSAEEDKCVRFDDEEVAEWAQWLPGPAWEWGHGTRCVVVRELAAFVPWLTGSASCCGRC